MRDRHAAIVNTPRPANGDTSESEALDQNFDDASSDRVNRENETSQRNGNGKPSSAPPSRAEDGSAKPTVNDDGSTQISSDDSVKLPSFDTKSVASVATFALDEKESLRPDDSASIRAAAVEEEDLFSLPGSVVAGSRGGSDSGAKAFRDQLHEIAYMSSIPQRGGGGPMYQIPVVQMGASSSSLAQANSVTTNQVNPILNTALPTSMSENIPPDEKLLEALQSQRDRVWVLKLEQDIIDFVGQSKYDSPKPANISTALTRCRENTLTLPQCNAFYRMLAHKLADYYRLDHIANHLEGGSAVIITRTPFCRM
jgi:hypothetical protein